MVKLNPAGTALEYATFLGGEDADFAQGIAVDADGNAFVTGDTVSTRFPTTQGAFQTQHGGQEDFFITKVNPLGRAWSIPPTWAARAGKKSRTFTAHHAASPLIPREMPIPLEPQLPRIIQQRPTPFRR